MAPTDPIGISSVVAFTQNVFLICLAAIILIAGSIVLYGVWCSGRGAAEDWAPPKR
jgi:hypothetical protein